MKIMPALPQSRRELRITDVIATVEGLTALICYWVAETTDDMALSAFLFLMTPIPAILCIWLFAMRLFGPKER